MFISYILCIMNNKWQSTNSESAFVFPSSSTVHYSHCGRCKWKEWRLPCCKNQSSINTRHAADSMKRLYRIDFSSVLFADCTFIMFFSTPGNTSISSDERQRTIFKWPRKDPIWSSFRNLLKASKRRCNFFVKISLTSNPYTRVYEVSIPYEKLS